MTNIYLLAGGTIISCIFNAAHGDQHLFENNSLDDWYIVGPQVDFTLEDGVLTGEGKERRNSFLTSKKTYRDFSLSVEVKVIKGNSGIQIRSHDIDNRLVGYQIEIDPSERAWSGGLYDEGRRALVTTTKQRCQGYFSIGRMESVRNRMHWSTHHRKGSMEKLPPISWDFMDLDGHIGFQIHSGDSKVMWRNAKISEIAQDWTSDLKVQSLFDGKTLDGMKPVGGGTWRVEDGVIVGRQSSVDSITGLMWITQPYDNYAIKLKFKVDKGNSGFFFRSQQIPYDSTGIRGVQVEIDRTPNCGGLYESGGRGWLATVDKKYSNYDEWNDLMV